MFPVRTDISRNTKGQFQTNTIRNQCISPADLPKKTNKLIDLYQSKLILPTTSDGYLLRITNNLQKHGDTLNDNWVFRKIGATGNESSYKSVRPVLGYQDNLPMVQVNEILFDICQNLSNEQIALKQGWVCNTPKGKSFKTQSISRLRRNVCVFKNYNNAGIICDFFQNGGRAGQDHHKPSKYLENRVRKTL